MPDGAGTEGGEHVGLLRSTRILEGQAGVPPYAALAMEKGEKAGEAYAALLRTMGFDVELSTVAPAPDVSAGWIVDVSPAPGEVLPRGATVRVSVAD